MCGIAGYIGIKQAEPFIVDALKNMEYRGYDGFGYLIIDKQGRKHYVKKLKGLPEHGATELEGSTGIGHTRWATHGKPDLLNTHPIMCGREIHYRHSESSHPYIKHIIEFSPLPDIDEPNLAIVHNGTIDNYVELRNSLKTIYRFTTDTDTEVLGNYIHFLLENRVLEKVEDVEKAIRPVFEVVKGSFAALFVTERFPHHIIAIKKGTPLLCSVGEPGYFASDINALSGYAPKAYRMQDGDIMIASEDKVYPLPANSESFMWDDTLIEDVPVTNTDNLLVGHPHYMLKEIHQQVNFDFDKIKTLDIPRPDKIFLFGCGSSWHAALAGRHYFEQFSAIPTEVEYASEMSYRFIAELQPKNTLFIALTQSGETKDTLEVMKRLQVQKRNILLLHNNDNSQATKYCTHAINIGAGLEKGVAATKTFTGQLLTLLKQSLIFSPSQLKLPLNFNTELVNKVKEVLDKTNELKSLAKDISKFNHCLYLGKAFNYPVALEGALKMKEVSYLHAEAMPASELKHGPLALIDDKTLSVFICGHTIAQSSLPILTNMAEVKARGGIILAISDSRSWGWVKTCVDYSFIVPDVAEWLHPILMSIPLQLLAYYVAIERNINPDKPRNLAKSVTV